MKLTALTAAALLTIPSLAWADAHEKGQFGALQVKVSAGLSEPHTRKVNGQLTSPLFPAAGITGNADFNATRGPVGCAALGYDFGIGSDFPIIVEGEGCVRRTTHDEIQIDNVSFFGTPSFGLPSTNLTGESLVASGTANAWLYMKRNDFRVRVGGGFGFARENADFDRVNGIPANVDDTFTEPAWMVGAGMDFCITDGCGMFAAIDLRHFEVFDSKPKLDGATTFGGVTVPYSVRGELGGYKATEVMLGIGLMFNTPTL